MGKGNLIIAQAVKQKIQKIQKNKAVRKFCIVNFENNTNLRQTSLTNEKR
tara:strand:+ start:65 stop:214 length:150 start_codon:yes stop_codon:yes gene_type:complete